MYIRLGNANLVYEQPSYDDFMIFAEVVDSKMSYERPILVRTKDQLDIWFGREFTSREYFEELLDSGVSLYLFRPVSDQENTLQEGYVDLTDYYMMPNFYDEEPTLPKVGKGVTESKILYKVYDAEGIYRTKNGDPYSVCLWYYENETKTWTFIRVQDLPQNINGFKTNSLNNRDVLKINSKNSKLTYTNPKFKTKDSHLQFIRDHKGKKFKYSLDNISLERIKAGYQTLAFDISYSRTAELKDGSYLILPGSDGKSHLLYYGIRPKKVNTKYYSDEITFTNINELLRELGNLGYILDSTKNILYSTFPVKTTYFYDIPEFELTPSYNITHQLLGEQTEEDAVLRFYSKTLGPGSDNGNITVTLTPLDNEAQYRVEIERFDYSEVFEGYFIDRDKVNTERLDYAISKYSSLVYCEYIPETWIEPNIGKFELTGAEEEKETVEMYNKGLEILFSDRDDLCLPDFLLIPAVEKYGTELEEETDVLTTYKKLLDYAQTFGCQVLIENSDQEDSVKHYKHNYIKDAENRLVYFYKGMTINGWERPGYYLFLRGLLTDVYSISTNIAYYVSPADRKNPYTTTFSDLEEKKCNYLVDNNQVYYYKKYLGGKNPETSMLMRFVLGKISRELEKNKWHYLAERMVGRLTARIEGVLERVKNSFSIIRSINITDFDLVYSENKIKMSIETRISDLVENDIRLDIVINYNKTSD